MEELSRTELLIGREGIARLAGAHVAVFGIGGVGGYVCEGLARSGVGALDLIDNDRVSLSNINRQIIALHSTVGEYKTDVMRDRIRDINPHIEVRVHHSFVLPENIDQFPFETYDYIVDAIDTVAAKLALAVIAQEKEIPMISAMGAGNKLDPFRFRAADIYETRGCPLAKVMRHELKKRGVKSLRVVYSEEPPMKVSAPAETEGGRRSVPGSIAFVPSAAGMMIAGEVIKGLLKA